MPNTTNYNLPYPASTDPIDIAGDVQALAESTDVAIKNLSDSTIQSIQSLSDSTTQSIQNISTDIKRVTSNTTAVRGDYIIIDSVSDVTITLPSSPQENDIVRIAQFSTGVVTFSTTDTINGNISTTGQGTGISALYTNSAWWCVPFASSQQGSGWTRPNDWLPLSDLIEGEEVIYAISRIYDEYDNTFSIHVLGGCTIEWGDGATQTLNYGGIATYTYNYSSIPNSTLTADGFKQAIIEIRPITGNHLTLFAGSTPSGQNLCRFAEVKMTGSYLQDIGYTYRSFADTYSLIIKYSNQITNMMVSDNWDMSLLENMELDLPNATSIDWNGSYAMNAKRCIFNTSNNLQSMAGLFSDSNYNNAELLISDTSNVTNFNYMFGNCFIDENNIPYMDTLNATNMSNMFNWNAKIKRIPSWLDTSNVMNASGMFYNCANLESIPPLNMQNVLSAGDFASSCGRLTSSGVYNIKVSHGYDNCNLSSSALNNIYNNLGNPVEINVLSVGYNDGYIYWVFDKQLTDIGGTVILSGFDVPEWNGSFYMYGNNDWNGVANAKAAWYGYPSPSMPTVMGTMKFADCIINVSNNPGVTSDNPSIAIAKGWTVTG